MKHRKAPAIGYRRATVAAALIGGVVLAPLLTALPASAVPFDRASVSSAVPFDTGDQQPDVGIQSSKRFVIQNSSRRRLKLASVSGSMNFEGRPADGSILMPGEGIPVEVQQVLGKEQRDTFTYDVLAGDDQVVGEFKATFTISAWKMDPSTSATSTHGDVFTSERTATYAGAEDDPIDPAPAPTIIDLPATSPEAADLLAQYCSAPVPGTMCYFAPYFVDDTAERAPVVGGHWANDTDEVQQVQSEVEVTDSVTTNLPGSDELRSRLVHQAKTDSAQTHPDEWFDSVTASDTIDAELAPHSDLTVTVTQPVIKYTGIFFIQTKDTVWQLSGATFDVPDQNRDAVFNAVAGAS